MKKKLLWSLILIALLTLCLGVISVSASGGTYGYLTYEIVDDEVIITDCDTAVRGEFSIPSTLGGYPVTVIGDDAFRNCDYITSIIIPDTVTSIGQCAFENCYELGSITIPPSVLSIERNAFNSCNVTCVYISDLGAWCSIGFSNEASNPTYEANGHLYLDGNIITDIEIPDGVTGISNYAFCGYGYVNTLTIPDSVTTIGERAFYWCDSLTAVNLGKGIETIGDGAFYDCWHLNTVFYFGSEDEWNSIEIGYDNNKLTKSTIVCNPVVKTYSFVTNCDANLPDITDYAVYNAPKVKNGDKRLFGWYDNEILGGNPVTFPYHGDATTLYALWLDKTGTGFDDAFIATANEKYTLDISEYEIVYFELVPTHTGEYRFYTEGDCTTWGDLFDSNRRDLYADGGNEDNFYISHILTAGETYYIAVELVDGFDPFTFVIEDTVDYTIKSLKVKDAMGNELTSIPTGHFFASVSFAKVCATDDAVIVLARYTEGGAFDGLLYVKAKNAPERTTIELMFPVDNTEGNITSIKAFCWDSLSSMNAVGNSLSFPAK